MSFIELGKKYISKEKLQEEWKSFALNKIFDGGTGYKEIYYTVFLMNLYALLNVKEGTNYDWQNDYNKVSEEFFLLVDEMLEEELCDNVTTIITHFADNAQDIINGINWKIQLNNYLVHKKEQKTRTQS